MLQTSMSTISENITEEQCSNKHQYDDNRERVANENDSGDEASYSSATSLDSLADSRARSQKARNVTEKRRRDKLNMYINQLGMLLPSSGHQRMDKSSVLKQGVDYLRRFSRSSVDGSRLQTSSFLSADELGELAIETLSGIVLVINEQGTVVYAAEHAKSVFGLESAGLIGQPVEKLVHPDDLCNVRSKLKRSKTDQITPDTSTQQQQKSSSFVECTFRLALEDTEDTTYREVYCKGRWKDRNYTECDKEQTEGVLVLIAAPTDQCHLRELCYSKIPSSFSSRHGMDGKFLFVDTSCTRVTGYLPYELLNTSIYLYVREADLEEVVKAHRSLMAFVDVGSILVFFQFRSKSDQWLLMKVILRVTYNPMTSKPEYINANLSLATRNEISQYKKLKLSNTANQPIDAESITPSSASLLLASLAKQRPERKKSKEVVPTEKEQFKTEAAAVKVSWQGTDNQPKLRTSTQRRGSSLPGTSSGEAEKMLCPQMEISEGIPKEPDVKLYAQVNEKIEILSVSVKRQKKQLAKIHEMMMAVRPKMLISDGLLKQQEQEQQIFDYISSTVGEQEKQCKKLKAILEGKMKISETKSRAMELRGKARIQSASAANATNFRGSLSPAFNGNRGKSRMHSNSQNDGFHISSGVENILQPQRSLDNQMLHSPAERSQDNYEVKFMRQDSYPSERSVGSHEKLANQDQHSLQRQLQQLQHQQDVLNAQGMVLAAQGTISKDQLEFVKTLLQQQKTSLSESLSPSMGHFQSEAATGPHVPQGPSFEHLKQFQEDQQLLNAIQFQGRGDDSQASSRQSEPASVFPQFNDALIGKILSGSSLPINTSSGNGAPYQVLSQLQRLQQELQLQMQLLSKQPSQGGTQQPENLAKVVLALRQLQQMQIRLLQDALPENNRATTSPDYPINRSNAEPHSTTNGYMQQCSQPEERITSMKYAPTGFSSPCSSVAYPYKSHGPNQSLANQEQQEDTTGLFQLKPSASQAPSQLLDGSNTRGSQNVNGRSKLPSMEYGLYPSFSSSDHLSNCQTSTDTCQTNRGRNMMFSPSDQDDNAQGTSDGKCKKLTDDENFSQYVDSLPGQTQQLMQLHQAQRMHIVRRQHQQLQALQHGQIREQQPQQQMQYQQHQQEQQRQINERQALQHQLQQQQMQQPGVCDSTSEASTRTMNYNQESSTLGRRNESDITDSAFINQWQNDLQADQVNTMSDSDLFELLSGQNAMSFTEEDEQVLDLLIAEGGDIFSI